MRPVCRRCSALLRQARRFTSSSARPSISNSASALLSKPVWSVASLLPPGSKADAPPNSTEEPISRVKLHHLLRLSALPLPESEAEESAMLRTLHSQLHFVRDVQSVDTTGVEPLRSLRDETTEGVAEAAIGLQELQDALGKEIRFGHKKRPKRLRGEKVDTKGVEDWDPLKTASRTAGKYFIVQSRKEVS
ncbi:hypothetical protein CGRA01v4_01023 [Colletotrichum graminicola]|uniref:Glutamyl-tRNA amidotransferase complex subunit Gta3 domain-containing protein n=1 Tax=Colletotrichum graminicola (strain M1.001 / M2 / FGSC 10212) TaxID=645133 RepID=E3QGT9_COLGM|nr:uncharacterized protein GLRG_05221 [Colletotrichum graminicola M1.001]EFQ30077.1 hypothetical protein GLRG_05221 [Colletotrichum graminicola M1.001]WDK09745.1 hypothetical protein CGRA01v4_01023 [Colletotrichum graminicola]